MSHETAPTDTPAETMDETIDKPSTADVVEDVLVEEVLVEEVSIDGMCGVY